MSLLACLVAGLAAATVRPVVGVGLVGITVLGGICILERRRMAPVLWASAGFTAPLQGFRVALLLAVSDVLIVAALAAILPDGLPGWRRVVPRGLVVAFGLIVVAGLSGTFFAPDIGASLTNLVKIVLAAAGSVTAMALWNPRRAALRRFAWFWFAGAVVSAAWAAATPRTFVGRAVGFTSHPNHFGLVCALGVGLGLGLAMSSARRARLAAVSGVVLLMTGVGLSGSRSAIIALAVTIGLTAVLTRRFRFLLVTGAVVVLALVAVILGVVHVPESNTLSRLGGGGGSSLSDAGRKQLAAEAVAIISRHPATGEGFEFAQAAHNIYLQVLVVGGPLALVGFLFVGGLLIRAGVRASRAARERPDGPVLAGLTAGYAGYLVSGTFDNILWDRYLWVYVGMLVVFAASNLTLADGSAGRAADAPAERVSEPV